jgi:membrane protease YdiL (CAAX protease family)
MAPGRVVDRPTENAGLASLRLPVWQIGLVLIGFPILYLLNSFTPWSIRLFGRADRAAFFPFFASILTLHWLSAATVLLLLRRAGASLAQLGLRVSGKRALVLAGKLVIVGVVVVAVRELAGYAAARPHALAFFPRGFAENLFFVPAAISAGFCEELVYRGFGITALVGRGLRIWQAVMLSSFSFVFIHGLGGLYAFPVFFAGGLLYAYLYLSRGNLLRPMIIHSLGDTTAMLMP